MQEAVNTRSTGTDQGAKGVEELVSHLDAAVALRDPAAITERIKRDLQQMIRADALRLPETFRRPRADGYARRLLYRDPDRSYTAVVMTWGPGQGTPLHDHAGIWCVEGVVEGSMEVTQYDLVDEAGDGCRFTEQGRVQAAVGSAGCLIPPFEYHVLANSLSDRPSITLHIYGGEMDRCDIFERRPDGHYVRRQRSLAYHD